MLHVHKLHCCAWFRNIIYTERACLVFVKYFGVVVENNMSMSYWATKKEICAERSQNPEKDRNTHSQREREFFSRWEQKRKKRRRFYYVSSICLLSCSIKWNVTATSMTTTLLPQQQWHFRYCNVLLAFSQALSSAAEQFHHDYASFFSLFIHWLQLKHNKITTEWNQINTLLE